MRTLAAPKGHPDASRSAGCYMETIGANVTD